MNIKDFEVYDKTVYKGVGKLFYEQGMPISISVKHLKDNGYNVSILHVADECLKHGWSADTTYKKLREDFVDSGENVFDLDILHNFCHADYVTQRELIFKSLFANKEEALDKLNKLIV